MDFYGYPGTDLLWILDPEIGARLAENSMCRRRKNNSNPCKSVMLKTLAYVC